MRTEDLMCCGNCKHREQGGAEDKYALEYCDKDYFTYSYEVCSKWEFDGCTWEKRLDA